MEKKHKMPKGKMMLDKEMKNMMKKVKKKVKNKSKKKY